METERNKNIEGRETLLQQLHSLENTPKKAL
jgi:hypothetical protein